MRDALWYVYKLQQQVPPTLVQKFKNKKERKKSTKQVKRVLVVVKPNLLLCASLGTGVMMNNEGTKISSCKSKYDRTKKNR